MIESSVLLAKIGNKAHCLKCYFPAQNNLKPVPFSSYPLEVDHRGRAPLSLPTAPGYREKVRGTHYLSHELHELAEK